MPADDDRGDMADIDDDLEPVARCVICLSNVTMLHVKPLPLSFTFRHSTVNLRQPVKRCISQYRSAVVSSQPSHLSLYSSVLPASKSPQIFNAHRPSSNHTSSAAIRIWR